jgi:hypothetical protein
LKSVAHPAERAGVLQALRTPSLHSASAPRYTRGEVRTQSGDFLQPNVDKLLKKHRQLNHLDMAKVTSHVQRDSGDWIINTLMLDGYDVPFKYSRKTAHKNLEGARVNLTYYSETKTVSGLEFETMTVVRIRRA